VVRLTNNLLEFIRRSLVARRPDLLLAAAIAGAALVAIAVLKLASEIAEGEIDALDGALLSWMRETMGDVPGLRTVMLDLTALGDFTVLVLVVVAAAGLLLVLREYRLALFLVGETLAGALLVWLLKDVFGRPRPTVVEHWTVFGNASYPSGHAANSAIIYLSLAVLLAGRLPSPASRIYALAVAMLLSFGVGVSRMFLGVHWPSDVLAGWAFGAGWATLCWVAAWWLSRRSARGESERPVG
jgi:undecaprenyl-diphosphatase